jgi:hypothetical protein
MVELSKASPKIGIDPYAYELSIGIVGGEKDFYSRPRFNYRLTLFTFTGFNWIYDFIILLKMV